jgi:hypothetical protein
MIEEGRGGEKWDIIERGWMDEWMNGWMDEWMNGWDGWVNGEG